MLPNVFLIPRGRLSETDRNILEITESNSDRNLIKKILHLLSQLLNTKDINSN